MEYVKVKLGVSERRVCRVIDQPRSTQRDHPIVRDGEACLRAEIIRLAGKYGRYGYRRITAETFKAITSTFVQSFCNSPSSP